MRQHKKDTPYKCTLCSFGAVNNGILNSHMKAKHTRVNCNVCSQEFCNTFILKRHQAKSHGIIPSDNIQCQHCSMFFRIPGNLTKHMAIVHPYLWTELTTNKWTLYSTLRRLDIKLSLYLEGRPPWCFW